MDIQIQEIYQIIKDYRAEENRESVKITPEKIKQWVSQFEEADQEFLLSELKNIFSKRYCSKPDAMIFLKSVIDKLSDDLGYASKSAFLDNAYFLDLQAYGKSQKKVLEILIDVLKINYNYDISNIGNKSKKHYVYLDDVLCTGNTFFQNIKDWLDTEENGVKMLQKLKNNEIDLKAAYIFIVTKNYNKKIGQFYHRVDNNFGNMITTYSLFWLDGEILMPVAANQPETVTDYETKIAEKADEYAKNKNFEPYKSEFYRTLNQPVTEDFFSSEENRIRFENILLNKGIEILNKVNVKKDNIRPLGYSLPAYKDFGSGALLFTWRNVPNNTPLVFWYSGGDFTPLFENYRSVDFFFDVTSWWNNLDKKEFIYYHTKDENDYDTLSRKTNWKFIFLVNLFGWEFAWNNPSYTPTNDELDLLLNLKKIDAGNSEIAEFDINSLEPLLVFRNLTELDLRNTCVKDFKVLSELKKLEILNLEFTMINTLESLANLNLKVLNICYCYRLNLQEFVRFKITKPECQTIIGWNYEQQKYF